MHRRSFLRGGAAVCAASCLPSALRAESGAGGESRLIGPTSGIIPVVGDGKWIWKKPPEETGYLEPRQFDVEVGVMLHGKRGAAQQIKATTAAPIELPEQRVESFRVDAQGCRAAVRQLGPGAAQLLLTADGIAPGQTIGAVARYRMTLLKAHQGYHKDQFPAEQEFPKEFRKQYLYDSPGIQTRTKEVRRLAEEIGGQLEHPWDKAQAFNAWVWEHINWRVGYYTSVVQALKDRAGDCEERAAVFSALCRASGILTRLVWVPGHCWEEICLRDHEGQLHWLPVHTSGYDRWFGFTGAHELVLQKGDKVYVPEKRKTFRLLADWMQYQGAKPEVRYTGRIVPVASEVGGDPGPGTRNKQEDGKWMVLKQELIKYFNVKDEAEAQALIDKAYGIEPKDKVASARER